MRAGEKLTGMFVHLRDPAVCESLGRLGFDTLCVEGEHTAMGPETIERLVSAVEHTPAAALVRVAGNDPSAIACALDAGAQGVVVPRVSSAAEAMAAVQAARLPPVGLRGLGPSRAAAHGTDIPGYQRRANDELLLAIMVETRQALEELDELVAVDGVDLVFVGPGDLASSLGIEDPRSPELRDAIVDVLARAREAGRLTGMFAATPEDAVRWHASGVNLVFLGSDMMWLTRAAAIALGDVRQAPANGATQG
ncbi:4-hydroxy-2-oxo-heptane-1,7-dioate aldolase [Baekduia alba]|nr:4-hydroxy-2-oxo-heptane-1,7-dioate aldolase [Baekduia alba]